MVSRSPWKVLHVKINFINIRMLEYRVQDYLHSQVGGNFESPVLFEGTKVGIIDIETDEKILEVKSADKWKHAIGQLLVYSLYCKKKMCLCLFGDMELSLYQVVEESCKRLNIELMPVHLIITDGKKLDKKNMIPDSFPSLDKTGHLNNMKNRRNEFLMKDAVKDILESKDKLDLQIILRALGLDTKGKKVILIDRILSSGRVQSRDDVHHILNVSLPPAQTEKLMEKILETKNITPFELPQLYPKKEPATKKTDGKSNGFDIEKFANACTVVILKDILKSLDVSYKSKALKADLVNSLIEKYNSSNDIIESIVDIALKESPSIISVLPENMKTKEVCEYAFLLCAWCKDHIPEKYITQDLCNQVFEKSIYNYKHIPDKYKTLSMSTKYYQEYGNSCIKDIPERYHPQLVKSPLEEEPPKKQLQVDKKIETKNEYLDCDSVPVFDMKDFLSSCTVDTLKSILAANKVEYSNSSKKDTLIDNVYDFYMEDSSSARMYSIFYAAVKVHPKVLSYIPDELITLQLCKSAFSAQPTSCKYIPERFKTALKIK